MSVEEIDIPETWSVLAHQTIGDLVLSVSQDGQVSGSIFGDQIDGFWSAESGTLTFVRTPGAGDWESHQLFRGYRFTLSAGSQSVEVLSGSFDAFPQAGPEAPATEFGWFAIQRGTTLVPDSSGAGDHLLGILKATPHMAKATVERRALIANGHTGTLYLQGPDLAPPGQRVWGDAFDANLVTVKGFVSVAGDAGQGFPLQRISLLRRPTDPDAPGSAYQVFGGHRVHGRVKDTGGWAHIVGWAGSFTALAGTGGTPDRSVFGWMALGIGYSPD